MLSSTRHDTILQRLRSDGEVSVQALAADLRVSTSTIRRDLDTLSQDGGLLGVCGPDRIAVLGTNQGADPATLGTFHAAGTEVITV